MRSGAIIKRAELWRKTTSRNSFGEFVETWAKVGNSIRAYKGSIRGFQTTINDELIDLNWVRIVVRNHRSFDERDRFKINGILYSIEHIKPDDKERWLTVMCKKINE